MQITPEQPAALRARMGQPGSGGAYRAPTPGRMGMGVPGVQRPVSFTPSGTNTPRTFSAAPSSGASAASSGAGALPTTREGLMDMLNRMSPERRAQVLAQAQAGLRAGGLGSSVGSGGGLAGSSGQFGARSTSAASLEARARAAAEARQEEERRGVETAKIAAAVRGALERREATTSTSAAAASSASTAGRPQPIFPAPAQHPHAPSGPQSTSGWVTDAEPQPIFLSSADPPQEAEPATQYVYAPAYTHTPGPLTPPLTPPHSPPYAPWESAQYANPSEARDIPYDHTYARYMASQYAERRRTQPPYRSYSLDSRYSYTPDSPYSYSEDSEDSPDWPDSEDSPYELYPPRSTFSRRRSTRGSPVPASVQAGCEAYGSPPPSRSRLGSRTGSRSERRRVHRRFGAPSYTSAGSGFAHRIGPPKSSWLSRDDWTDLQARLDDIAYRIKRCACACGTSRRRRDTRRSKRSVSADSDSADSRPSRSRTRWRSQSQPPLKSPKSPRAQTPWPKRRRPRPVSVEDVLDDDCEASTGAPFSGPTDGPSEKSRGKPPARFARPGEGEDTEVYSVTSD